jgi:alanyl-tRNA synthetase
VTVITNQTPFYGESGGQMGDAGLITNDAGLHARVDDTSKPLGRLHAHQAKIEAGKISVGDSVNLVIDATRRDQIRANHSATHLLHAALRKRIGDHVTQKGSLVADNYLRFDFSHSAKIERVGLDAIESDVNHQIRLNTPVETRLMTPDDAVAAGAMALFGEKYGDEVRVLSMGTDTEESFSIELCGGTHVQRTGDIGTFVVLGEESVASGVRRIEAVTGKIAFDLLRVRANQLRAISTKFNTTDELVGRFIGAVVENNRRLEKEVAEAKKSAALGGGGAAAEPEDVGGVMFLGQSYEGLDPKDLRGLANDARARIGSGVVAFVTVNDAKASILIAVSDDLTARFSAVDLVRAGVTALGGQGGGGKPDMAQGGGPDGSKAADAIAAVKVALSA